MINNLIITVEVLSGSRVKVYWTVHELHLNLDLRIRLSYYAEQRSSTWGLWPLWKSTTAAQAVVGFWSVRPCLLWEEVLKEEKERQCCVANSWRGMIGRVWRDEFELSWTPTLGRLSLDGALHCISLCIVVTLRCYCWHISTPGVCDCTNHTHTHTFFSMWITWRTWPR